MTFDALIVVDIQNDFLPGGALAVNNGDQIVPIVNQLIDRFSLIVATQDWHPAGHLSFASSHPGKKVGDMIELNGTEQILWPYHCVQNTDGANFCSQINSSRFDHVVRKGTDPNIDSYSGFFDNDHKQSTGLSEYLRRHSVTRCCVCGLATDYCVKFTALDALACGFDVTVASSACQAVNLQPQDEALAIQQMRNAGAEIQ